MQTKYEYKILYLQQESNITDKINEYGKEGWRILNSCYSDGGNILIIILEKEWDEMTQLEFDKANMEMKNRKLYLPT